MDVIPVKTDRDRWRETIEDRVRGLCNLVNAVWGWMTGDHYKTKGKKRYSML